MTQLDQLQDALDYRAGYSDGWNCSQKFNKTSAFYRAGFTAGRRANPNSVWYMGDANPTYLCMDGAEENHGLQPT